MKTLTISIVSFLLCTSLVFSQNDCSKYYPLDEGTTFQHTNYNRKGKVTGTIDYKVTNIRTENDFLKVTFDLKMNDKKGDFIMGSTYDIKCNEVGVLIDYKSMSNPQMFSQFENFDFEISGTDLNLPNDLFIGQELPDGNLHMVVNMGISMNMNITIKDRKVIAEETITTPSGTYKCFVLTSTQDMDMMMKVKGSSKQWIAEGVGMVKQESYDMKGSLTSYSELTKFND